MWPFDSILFMEGILPFLLIFVLVFAILQKTKILGDGKTQIDALVSLAIALTLIAVPQPRDIIVGIMPWLGVGLAVMLVFLLLYGFVADEEAHGQKWQKVVFGILAGLFVAGVVIYVSGLWKPLSNWLSGSGSAEVWGGILMLIIVGGAFIVALTTGKKGGSGKGSDS